MGGSGWGEQGSPFDKTRDGLITLEADGESHLPPPCRQELILMQPLKDSKGRKKKREKENVFTHGRNCLER